MQLTYNHFRCLFPVNGCTKASPVQLIVLGNNDIIYNICQQLTTCIKQPLSCGDGPHELKHVRR